MIDKSRSQADSELVHGALDHAELAALGITPSEVLDFSANTNPFGPAPGVRQALEAVPLDRYPDRESLALRQALAAQLGVPVEQVLAGNGSSELIWLAALAFLQPGDDVLVLEPTYGEYARAAALAGARTHAVSASPGRWFEWPTDVVEAALDRLAPRLAFICRPNNPTGTVLPLAHLSAWADGHRETLFVVDEAYLDFSGEKSALTLGADNLLVLRSLTKAHALAGLRLGFAIGTRERIEALRRVRPPWSVNALAQAAGVAALADTGHLIGSLHALARAKRQLVEDLAVAGFAPLDSATSFFLLEVGDAAHVRDALLRRHLLVRDCTSFGLPTYVRISARQPEHNARLLAALHEVA